MKYTVCSFSQEEAIKLGLDTTDLLILRWIVDFSPKMTTETIDNKVYFWVKYQSILEDLPILDIKKRALEYRLKKLVDLNVLEHKTVKKGGTFSYYSFGEMYMQLIADPYATDCRTGMQKIAEQNNPSTKYNPSIKYIVEYLNKKSGFDYKASSQKTQRFIHARLEEGFTKEDFEQVIDSKVRDWKNTSYEKYLRPETLFGTKFEGYLQTSKKNQKYNLQDDYESYIKSLEGEKI